MISITLIVNRSLHGAHVTIKSDGEITGLDCLAALMALSDETATAMGVSRAKVFDMACNGIEGSAIK